MFWEWNFSPRYLDKTFKKFMGKFLFVEFSMTIQFEDYKYFMITQRNSDIITGYEETKIKPEKLMDSNGDASKDKFQSEIESVSLSWVQLIRPFVN